VCRLYIVGGGAPVNFVGGGGAEAKNCFQKFPKKIVLTSNLNIF